MSISVGDKVLVTLDGWIFGADGRSYRCVWGTVRAIRSDQETLGIRTNARSTNWYLEIGDATIAGCQIHYAVKCGECPPDEVDDFTEAEGVVKEFRRPSTVYNADKEQK